MRKWQPPLVGSTTNACKRTLRLDLEPDLEQHLEQHLERHGISPAQRPSIVVRNVDAEQLLKDRSLFERQIQ
jgi:hypothetical protein